MAVVRELTVKLGLETDFSAFNKAQQAIGSIVSTAMDLVRAFEPVSNAIDEAVEAGSDIQETANKFGVVFGNAATGVQSQLDNIRKHTGATNLELQKMASNIGAIVKPSLGTAKAAGDVSSQMALLALDISSFNNVTSDRALIALRSGLIGSAEPLFAFGVDTRVAALEQEALRLGIKGSIEEMTEGQRVMLRVSAIQRQLGTQGATGDATRTADDYANASRNLSKAIEETTGMVGGLLLKQRTLSVLDMRRTINRVQDWIKANRKLIMQRIDEFMKRVHRVIGAVKNVVMDAKDAVVEWFEALAPGTKRIMKITAAVMAFALAMMLPFAPILLLIGLVALAIEDFETWRKGGESLIGDFIENFPQLIAMFKTIGKVIGIAVGAVTKWFKDKNLTGDEWAALVIHNVTKAAAIWTIMRAPMLIIKGLMFMITLAFVAIGVAIVAFGYAIFKAAVWAITAIGNVIDGISNLIEETGGIGPAFQKALNDAFNWWLEFFGSSRAELNQFIADTIESFKRWSTELGESLMAGFSGVLNEAAEFWADFFFPVQKEIDTFVQNAKAVLENFWTNVTDFWVKKAKDIFAKIGSFLPSFGDDDDEDQRRPAAARGAADEDQRRPAAARGAADEDQRRPAADEDEQRPAIARGAAAVRGAIDRLRPAGGPELQAPVPVMPWPLAPQILASPGAGLQAPRTLTQNTTQNITLTVTPAPGMDERLLADMVVEKIHEERDTELRSTLQSYAVEAP